MAFVGESMKSLRKSMTAPFLATNTTGDVSPRQISKTLASRKTFLRRLSMQAMDMVHTPVGSSYSTGTGVFFVVNFLLGTAPLTMPYAFAQAGFLLSTIFLAFCAGLAYITSTYVIETLALANALIFEEAENKVLDDDDNTAGMVIRKCTDEDKHLLAQLLRKEQSSKVFKIRDRLEFGQLGERMLPHALAQLLYACLLTYSSGALCVLAVTIITTLANVVLPQVQASTYNLGFMNLAGHSVLCWLFVVLVFPLCFVDIQKLRSQQGFWLVIKFVTIACMIICSLLQIFYFDELPDAAPVQQPPEVNISALPILFGNAVLAFMLHHSVPGLLAPLEKQADAPKVIATGYIIAYCVQVVLCGCAVRAYGTGLQPIYTLNFMVFPVKWVGQAISAYPMTLLSVYPITAITLRNNLTNFLGLPPTDSERPFAPTNVFATSVVVIIPAIVAMYTSNVQQLVSFFAGYLGLTLTYLWPCLFVFRGRNMLSLDKEGAFDLKSRYVNNPILIFTCTCWLGGIAFNTYKLFFAGA